MRAICDGCAVAVEDPEVRGENRRYCAECAAYLEEHPEHEEHRHYRLRERFHGTAVQSEPLILDNGRTAVTIRDAPDLDLGQQAEVVGTVTETGEDAEPKEIEAHRTVRVA